jgi:hypothetical protein
LKTKAEVTEQLKTRAENLTEQLKTKAEVTEQLKIKAENLTEHLSPSLLLRFFVFQKYYQHGNTCHLLTPQIQAIYICFLLDLAGKLKKKVKFLCLFLKTTILPFS